MELEKHTRTLKSQPIGASAGMLLQMQTACYRMHRVGWDVQYTCANMPAHASLHMWGRWMKCVWVCEEQACVKSAGLTAQVKSIVPSVIQMSQLIWDVFTDSKQTHTLANHYTHTHTHTHTHTSTDLKTWVDLSHFCTEPENWHQI